MLVEFRSLFQKHPYAYHKCVSHFVGNATNPLDLRASRNWEDIFHLARRKKRQLRRLFLQIDFLGVDYRPRRLILPREGHGCTTPFWRLLTLSTNTFLTIIRNHTVASLMKIVLYKVRTKNSVTLRVNHLLSVLSITTFANRRINLYLPLCTFEIFLSNLRRLRNTRMSKPN